MDAQGQLIKIIIERWILYIKYIYFILSLFQEGLRTNFSAYNSYFIWNISLTYSDSYSILAIAGRNSHRSPVGTLFQTE